MMYEKFREYLQDVCEGCGQNVDISTYFEQKTFLVGHALYRYTKEFKTAIDRGVGAATFDPEEVNLHDDKILIKFFQEFLNDDYDPPINPVELFSHLHGLWLIYACVEPSDRLHIEILLKLDITTLKLIQRSINIVPVLKDVPRVEALREHKRNELIKNVADVLAAFQHVGAKWLDDGSKKPIVIKGQRYTPNRLATRHMPMEMNEYLDPRTIIKHLKNLKKDGKI